MTTRSTTGSKKLERHPRLKAIASLVPRDGLIVDVGADHGYLAEEVGGVASDRLAHLPCPGSTPWVVSDGLRAFSSVDVAVLAGMGEKTILGILVDAWSLPPVVVCQTPGDTCALRLGLVELGYRIEAETLVVERSRVREVLRGRLGTETSTGHWLAFGPRLLSEGHPLLARLLQERIQRMEPLLAATKGNDAPRHTRLLEQRSFLRERLADHNLL